MRRMAVVIGLLVCLCVRGQSDTVKSLKEAVVKVSERYGVNFVYDTALEQEKIKSVFVPDKRLEENLQAIFRGTEIGWEVEGRYVLLHRKVKRVLSGTVRAENGETLIQVTVQDEEGGEGTLSDEHGVFSLALYEGQHTLRFSYVGYEEKRITVDMRTDCMEHVVLKESATPLGEVEITANLNSSLHAVCPGKVSLVGKQLATEFSLFSSPDLVKTLQHTAGVSSGVELLSGLYVRGGGNDENLLLLDGVPLYQVNHVGGLFSAFNTDVVKYVDFYKSGFPARYGGRLSSVVDVRTKDGDSENFHGVLSVGLLDGRVGMEGPIVKGRTSFSLAMRRSWADVFTAPAFAVLNKLNKEDRLNAGYGFHDVNAKVTHRFTERNNLSFSFYSGQDRMKVENRQLFAGNMQYADSEFYQTDFRLKWGNTLAALQGTIGLSSKLSADMTAFYARNDALCEYNERDVYQSDKEILDSTGISYGSRSKIDDAGLRMNFNYGLSNRYRLRWGAEYLHHRFRPQDNRIETGYADKNRCAGMSYEGNEVSWYVENDIRIGTWSHLNVGLRYALFGTERKWRQAFEPRVAFLWRWNEKSVFKFSYACMNQFMHQMSYTYLNLPTDSWVPSTAKVPPSRSGHYAAEFYTEPFSLPVSFCIGGYYKRMDKLLAYAGGMNLSLAPGADWEDGVCVGKGKSYGIECSATYTGTETSVDAGYTLSWSERKFDANDTGWYPDRFDNRHRFFLTGRHHFTDRIDAYVSWTYRSGDRITVPVQCVETPALPGVSGPDGLLYVYGKPNNAVLPAYHRLDCGVNFRKMTKRGYERVWNVSIYNVYSRMNPLYAQVERLPDGSFRGKGIGVFPAIPSFSYTLKF